MLGNHHCSSLSIAERSWPPSSWDGTKRSDALDAGQYIGLASLFSALRVAGLDESWTRFLHGVLSSPMGLNYHNELLHGFELEPNEATAALLYVGIIYLARGVGLSAAEP